MTRVPKWMRRCARGLAAAVLLAHAGVPALAANERNLLLRVSDVPLPFLETEDLPPRTGPIIELGRGINETGPLSPGIEMPWGAVWQPALWIYGSQRVAVLSTDGNRRTRPGGDLAEVATRMDLFANLQLTGTERFQAHLRPMDARGQFTGRTISPSSKNVGFDSHWDADFETLFFEGDLGEMFPRLDPQDRGTGDFGFAVGKFPVEFQNGYMVRDEMTAVGLTKTHIQMEGSSGVRLTGLWVFDHINKFNNSPDKSDVDLFGLFAEGDFPWGLLEVDVARTNADRDRGKQVNAGVGWTGHSAGNNYSMHANFSRYFDPPRNRYDSGSLLVLGYSTEVGLRRDILYANGYWAEEDFRRLASSGPPPLGPVGLSFAGVGLGGYRPALWPRPLDSAGFAVGMQTFFADNTANWAVEVGHRQDLDKGDSFGNTSGTALTTRVQYKFAERFLLQLDAYYAIHGRDAKGHQDAENDDDSAALRMELRVNF